MPPTCMAGSLQVEEGLRVADVVDLASLMDDVRRAAPEHRRVLLSEDEPRPDHQVGQEPEVDNGERDQKPLVLYGSAFVSGGYPNCPAIVPLLGIERPVTPVPRRQPLLGRPSSRPS